MTTHEVEFSALPFEIQVQDGREFKSLLVSEISRRVLREILSRASEQDTHWKFQRASDGRLYRWMAV